MSTLTAVRANAIDVDITDPKHKADPFPLYQRLRAESPVCKIRMPDKQAAWLVTRYDDVAAVLKDDRFSKDRFRTLSREQMKKQPWVPGVFKPLLRNMLDVDAPDHTRLRALVQKAFTPRRIDEMEPRIQALADDLVTEAAGIGRGRVDLIRDFALPLPATVIAEMLGVPAKDRHRFHRWSSTIVALNWSTWDMIKGMPSVWRFLRYIRKLVQRRRAEPADDLITALVQAEEQGEKLTEDEMVAMIFLLLIAGHETTVNLIGNGTLALLQNPGQLERLRREPALLRTAVEELLRYSSPLDTASERYAREDVTIAGVTIPQGSLVYAGIASANRDESHFRDAEALDLAREPNRHLSFGLGIHFCLGAPLARIEGQIAFNALVHRIRGLRLAVPADSLKWRRGVILRGMQSLPVAFESVV
jgi:cytochrome P450